MKSVKSGVEIVGVVAAAGALTLLSIDSSIAIALGMMLILVMSMAMVMSRPSVVVAISIVSMWFEAVGVGPVRAGRVVAGLAVVMLVLRLAASDWRPPALSVRAWITPMMFFVWAIISGFWAEAPGVWIQGMLELFLGFVYAVLIMAFLESEEHLARAFKVFVWAGVPIAIMSYVLFRTFTSIATEIDEENRIVGFAGNANKYASLLTCTFPLVVVFLRRATSQRERLMYYGIMVVLAMGLVTTGSRAGILAACLMTVYIFVTVPGITVEQRFKNAILSGFVLIIGILLAGFINPDRYSIAGFLSNADAGRFDLWNAATTSLGVHPLQGYGIGGFRTQMLDVLSKAPNGGLGITKSPNSRNSGTLEAHNTYLTMLLDLGAVGLMLYLLNTVVVTKNLWDLRRTKWADWAWALLGVNICLLFISFFTSSYNGKFQWTMVGIAGAAYTQQRTTHRSDRVRAHRGLSRLGVATTDGDRTTALPMDIRLRYPFATVLVLAVLGGTFLGYGGASVFGKPTYSTYGRVLVFNPDDTEARRGLKVSDARMQYVLNLADSATFAAEVKRRAGLEGSVQEVADMITATRPRFSAVVRMTITTSDREVAERAGPVLVESLDALVDRAREDRNNNPQSGREIDPEIAKDYLGPIYLHIYDDPIEVVGTPRAVFCGFLGGLLAAVVVVLGAMLLHHRRRLTSFEDISDILDVPFVASVPRPLRARSKNVVELYRSVGDLIDDACPTSPSVVGLVGNGIATLRSRVALGAAAGLATIASGPVVIVDLDQRRRPLSRQLLHWRSRGLADVLAGTADVRDLLRPIRRVPLARRLSKLVAATDGRMSVLPVGRIGRKGALDGDAVAAVISDLASTHLVVVNLAEVPSSMSVRSVLLECDAVLLCVLDGWSPVESTRSTVELLGAVVPNRLGYLLITQ